MRVRWIILASDRKDALSLQPQPRQETSIYNAAFGRDAKFRGVRANLFKPAGLAGKNFNRADMVIGQARPQNRLRRL